MDRIQKYIGLIENFLNQTISAHEFERIYIDTYLQDHELMPENLFQILDWLFAEVDSYTDFPLTEGENPDHYIDENQLRLSARKALDDLREYK